MQDIAAFAFDDALVRVVDRDGDPWFVLVDVCRVLEMGNPSQAASRLDDDEKGIISSDTLGGSQEVIIVSESGLYSLILTSRKPEAKRFKKWVTAELLPTLRKTGRYEALGRAGGAPWEWAADRGELHAKLSLIRESRLIFGNGAARALWLKLDLPMATVTAESVLSDPSVSASIKATAEAIVLLMEGEGEWSGTATDLLQALQGTGIAGLPATNQTLGNALNHASGILRDLGISITRVHSGVRRITIRRQPKAPA